MGAGTPASAAAPSSVPGRPIPAAQRLAETKWYQVKTAYQGQPEFLFEIAQRFLGDGNRLNEIFQLNKGRPQADGTSLQKPEAISAGWILLLPSDAKGDGVQTGPIPSTPPIASAAPASDPATPDPGAATTTAAAAPAADQDDGGSPILPIVLIVLGVLIVAGIVAGVLFARRRRGGSTAPTSGAAPSGGLLRQRSRPAGPGGMPTRNFDTAAAWTIDRALRVLVTGARSAGRSIPPVYGVMLDEHRIVLRLAAPDGEPTEPWEAIESGRIWQASLRDLQALPAANDVVSPCPRLVTLGTAGGTRELVDLGQSTGVISLQGDGAAARELVAAWAEELTSSPWAGDVRVIAGDVRPHLPGSERLSSLGSVRDALTAAEGDRSQEAYALRGGYPAAGAGAALGVLILGSAPGARDMERVQNLVNRPDAAWVVIVLGQTRQGRWRFTIHPDGRLETGALGITVYSAGTPATSGR